MDKKTAVAICWFLWSSFPASAQTFPNGIVASAGGVDVVFTPIESLLQGGLVRGTLSLRSDDGTTITGIHDLQVEKLHQVGQKLNRGVISPFTLAKQVESDPWVGKYDSYLLPENMVGPYGNTISSSSISQVIWETGYYFLNNSTNPANITEQSDREAAYRGNWYQLTPLSLSIKDQGSQVDLAHLVGIPGERTTIRMGIDGHGFESCSNGVGACFEFGLDWGDVIANEPPQLTSNILDIPDTVSVGATLALNADAHDNDGNVVLVEFLANGRLIPNCAFRRVSATCYWDPPVGDYTLGVRAVDNRGDTAYSPSRQFEVLKTPPTAKQGVLMSRGGVDVVITPDESLLDGVLVGGTISLRSGPEAHIVTFGSVSLRDVHQIALATPVGAFTMPSVGDGVLLSPEQARYDSHLLIGQNQIGGQAGGVLTESGLLTSPRDPAGVEALIEPSALGSALAYVGEVFHPGAFFLLPEFQTDSIDFARLVGVPGTTSSIHFDVLGAGFVDCGANANQDAIPSWFMINVPQFEEGTGSGACFDFTIDWGGVVIVDFDADGKSTVSDLNALVAALVSNETGAFDVTGDGVVDVKDLEQWLKSAAEENGFSESYLFGDSNLDGRVDVADLNALAKNWLGQSSWQGGDFAPDGRINESDLSVLGDNWQGSIVPSPAPSSVPEPTFNIPWLAFLSLAFCRRARLAISQIFAT